MIGSFKIAFAVFDCAGERTLDVTKEFAFQNPGWNCPAIDFDEGLMLAQAVAINSISDDLLAGAAFAANQDGNIGARYLINSFNDFLYVIGFAQNTETLL
ncbi:MAG: hypothetical protein BWX60_00252 [Candidatus Marinimicrobia bacterium ADurb.Bin030]|nr:MAG: hypothetical protein BWX60_00252 [Candidatus Marinimicrobia bacterium ADurb.Bin030]